MRARNYYKGHMDKIKGEGRGGGGGVQLGWVGGMGRKGTQLELNNNKKLKLKKRNKSQHLLSSFKTKCLLVFPKIQIQIK